MIANYFTLRFIANDLQATLPGTRAAEVFSQTKNELVLRFASTDSEQWLLVSCEPLRNFIYSPSSFHRARKNSVDLLQPIVNTTIKSVNIHAGDRIVRLQFTNGSSLMIELFGSKANVLLVNGSGLITDAFLRSKDFTGISYEQHSGRRWADGNQPPDRDFTFDDFRQKIVTIGHILVAGALKKVYPTYGSVLVKEVLIRAGIKDDTTVAQLAERELRRLFETAGSLSNELVSDPSPRIYYDAEAPVLFSIISLRQATGLQERRFESVHDAIRTFVVSSGKEQDFQKERDRLQQILRQASEKIERSLGAIQEQTASDARAREYELHAKLLTANLYTLTKGVRELEVENVFSPERELVRISLEPRLTPALNAERYFEKAKKSRRSLEESKERIASLHEEWEQIQMLLSEIEHVHTDERLREFLALHRDALAQRGIRTTQAGKKKEDPAIPFRIFTVEGGFQVWVGKSSENNDLLTMKHAKQNDLWFHVRGTGGSHVVLKIGTGKGEPGKQAIHQAASIAAYYSKMKGAKNVPVAMTQRKYVRKPKGAPPGTVTIEREKLLFVDPKLPDT